MVLMTLWCLCACADSTVKIQLDETSCVLVAGFGAKGSFYTWQASENKCRLVLGGLSITVTERTGVF